MTSEATNLATRREWRELGFFYDNDDLGRLGKRTRRAGTLETVEPARFVFRIGRTTFTNR